MILMEWLVQYWLEVLFSAFLGIVGITGRFIWKTLQRDYIDVVKQNQEDIKNTNKKVIALQENIEKKFDKIDESIQELSNQSKSSDLAIIRDTLLRKLRYGLQENSCITLADYETVNSLMEQYERLGGNGEIPRMYKKYETLQICTEHDQHVLEDDGEY